MTYTILYCFFIVLLFYWINKPNYRESFIPNSNSMYTNVYNPYGIKVDELNHTLNYNNKSVNYINKFNDANKNNLSNNKIETNKLLKQHNYPVCNFIKWNNTLSEETNLHIINNTLKFPLVVKYNFGCKGLDVYTDIISNKQLLGKVNYLKNKNKNSILIEEQTYGDKYRIMILNGKFIYANKQIKPTIKGDNNSSIQQLINNYPKPIKLVNKDLIAQQGYNMTDILEKNKEIIVTNVLSGMNGVGEIQTFERDIHPVNLNMFIKITELLGLNFSGIDYIGPDLSIPYFDGGNVIEINADPTFNIREQKKKGVVKRFINAIF
jgi:cyanophycin synthetase